MSGKSPSEAADSQKRGPSGKSGSSLSREQDKLSKNQEKKRNDDLKHVRTPAESVEITKRQSVKSSNFGVDVPDTITKSNEEEATKKESIPQKPESIEKP